MNKGKQFTVRGQVAIKEDKNGVFGLRILLFDKDHLFDDLLGSTTTNEQGKFQVHFRQADFRDLFEKAPDLYINVLDCSDNLVYSSEDSVAWDSGPDTAFAVALPRQKLEHHLGNMTPLRRLSGGVVSRDRIGLIDRALKLLETRSAASAGALGPGWFSTAGAGAPIPYSAAYCPAPDIFYFEDILELAWRVIDNEPCAAPEFIDVVDTIIHRREVRKPERIAAARGHWNRQDSPDTEGLGKLLQAKQELLASCSADTLIEKERYLPVIMATILVARGDRNVENRYLGVMLGELGALGQMDVIYRSALYAVRSNPGGIGAFADMLRFVGGTCGPNDGPVPWPLDPGDIQDVDDIWRLEKWFCTAQMELAVRRGYLRAGWYEIHDIDWSDGCPGSPIVITGENFGGGWSEFNRVQFTHRSGSNAGGNADAAAVVPDNPETDWMDTRIEVPLPEDAGPGPVSLQILDDFVTVCGSGIPVYRRGRGETFEFTGGAVYIRYFSANDRRGEFRIDPDSTVTLRWFVVPDDANVRLYIERDGTIIENNLRVDAQGDYAVGIPAGHASRTVCTLSADNACGPADPTTTPIQAGLVPALEIVGMEVTQAIQFYRAADHLTDDPADPDDPHDQADNSVRLVVGKPALLRVYARSGLPLSYDGGRIAPVSGTLAVERIEDGTATSLATIHALPATVEADYPVYDDERGDLGSTLNFLIPATHMSGRLRLSAAIQSPAGLLHAEATDQLTVDVTLEQTLRAAGIMVAYNGAPFAGAPAGTPNLVLAAPALADLRTTAARMIAAYPARSDSAATFRVAGTITQTVPLQDPMLPPGHGCSVNWNALMADLRAAAALDAPTAVGNWVYYGLLATGMPIGPPPAPVPGVSYVGGCGGNGIGAGEVGAGWTMAHEVGHALGLQHVLCTGDEGNPDPNYPDYDPYDPGSIGEYGFEFNGAMAIHSPLTTAAATGAKDFMSYCSDEWISPYHYDRLLNVGLLTPTTVPAGRGAGAYVDRPKNMEPQPLISIIGFAGVGDIRVHSVTRLVTRPNFIGGTPTDLTAELLDARGEVIAGAPVYNFRVEGPGQSEGSGKEACRPMIQAFVPNVARGSKLRIRRDEDVLWEREAPVTPVTVKQVRATITNQGMLEIDWDAGLADGLRSRSSLRWSNDRGETWNGLATGIEGHAAELSLAQVPGGEVMFEVMVDDGFDTASGASPPVRVPHKPPSVAILSPTQGSELRAGHQLRLWGVCTDEEGHVLPGKSCVWLLDGESIASGADVTIEAPSPGAHEIALRATDTHGTTDVLHGITVSSAS